jgi:hypothetical protein
VTGTLEFAQLETGAFPTSYIPTAGTSLSRAADVAAVQDADFSTTNLLAYSESFDVGRYKHQPGQRYRNSPGWAGDGVTG